MNIPIDPTHLNATSGVVLAWIAQAIIYGSVLALLTWILIKTVFRNASPTIHGSLWIVVLLKFILPFGPQWDYSLGNLIGDFRPPWMNSAAPAPTKAECASSTSWSVENGGQILLIPVTCEQTAATPPPPKAAAAATNEWSKFITPLAIAYVLAALLVSARRLFSYWRFARRCTRLPLADATVTAAIHEICLRNGVKRTPRVRTSDEAAAPFIFGMFAPTLVIAEWIATPLPHQSADGDSRHVNPELEAVVLHEIAHLRRWDLLVRYVQWLAGTLLFFWPVVAWVNRRVDLVREQACDEWALRYSRLSPTDYARVLLRAAQPARSWRVPTPRAPWRPMYNMLKGGSK